MADLLLVHNWSHLIGRSGQPPRIMEVPVNPKSAPFLVSAREGADHPLVWVPRAGKNDTIRVCPRVDATIRTKIIEEIVLTGEQKKLGNVHRLTKEGVVEAQRYLSFFGFDDIEALVSEDVGDTFLPDVVPVYEKEWVPSGHMVLVPSDRAFVGDLGQMSTGHIMAVVHNPLRGIAVVK